MLQKQLRPKYLITCVEHFKDSHYVSRLFLFFFPLLCWIRFAQLKASMAHFKHMWLQEFNPKHVRSASTISNPFHSIKELTLLIMTGRTKGEFIFRILHDAYKLSCYFSSINSGSKFVLKKKKLNAMYRFPPLSESRAF